LALAAAEVLPEHGRRRGKGDITAARRVTQGARDARPGVHDQRQRHGGLWKEEDFSAQKFALSRIAALLAHKRENALQRRGELLGVMAAKQYDRGRRFPC